MSQFQQSQMDIQRQQYAPIATGQPFQQNYGFNNVPFMQDHPMLQMLGQPVLQGLMGRQGMSPMGFHDQNMYDQMRQMRLTQMQNQMMAAAAQQDRNNYMRTARGLATMTGTPWDADSIAAANTMSNAMVAASPMLAFMAPDMLDQMGGMRGSSTVMAMQMFDANRYRMDPVTGRVGMTAATQQMQSELYRQLYETGNVGRMQGVTAGQVGMLYRDMTMRGMFGSEATPRESARAALHRMYSDRPGDFHNLMESRGISASDPGDISFNQVSSLMSNEQVQGEMRAYDTSRVRSTIESYVGAVSAVRDIFGDQGRPNAPMAELMNMLDQLSNGSMAQINPGNLQNMVRMTQNLASITGVSIDNALMLQQHASQVGSQMGLQPVFGVGAMQGGLAFRQAFSNMGMGRHTAWGAFSADQAMQADINLRQSANASAAANRVGAFMRLADTAQGIDPNSDMGLYAAALRTANETGATTWTDASGNERSINMSAGQISSMVTGAGLDAGQFTRLLGQEFSNREMVQQYQLGQSVARRTQYDRDVRPRLSAYAASSISRDLQSQLGMDSREALRVAQSISGGVVDDMMALSREDMADTDRRNEATVASLRRRLGDRANNMSDNDLRLLADSMYGHLNDRGMTDRRIGMNMQQVHVAFNDRVMSGAVGVQEQARTRQRMQEAMAPLRRGSALRAVLTSMQDPENESTVAELVAEAFGGVGNEDIRDALVPGLERVSNQQTVITGLEEELASINEQMGSMDRADASNPEWRALRDRRNALQQRIDREYTTLGNLSGSLNDDISRHGYYDDSGSGGTPNAADRGASASGSPNSNVPISQATIGQLASAIQGGGSSGPMQIRGTVTLKDERQAELELEAPDSGADDEPVAV